MMIEAYNNELITLEEVEESYFECRHNKRNSKGALEYEMNYEINNYRLWQELNEGRYEVGRSMAFCVTRPKIREVFAADFRDRVVHHIIMRKFLHIFEAQMIEDSYNCRRGKGTYYGVNRIRSKIESISEGYTKETWVLKCDLSGFFMSIDRDILWGMIEELLRREYKQNDIDRWLELIRKVVYNRPEQNCIVKGDIHLWDRLPDNKTLFKSNGKGLPIGNLTSQIFANFYMTEFDRWAQARLGEGYGRFVDDFIAISRDKTVLLKFLHDARRFLQERLHLKLHPNKIYLQEAKKGVLFVGTYIKPFRTYTSNRTVANAFKAVHSWNVQEEPDDARFVLRINSYMGFLVHNATYGIRWRLWKKIKRKHAVMCINMKKLKLKKNKKNELHQNDNVC